MTLRTTAAILIAVLAAMPGADPASAQQLPDDWQMRLDRAGAAPDNISFHGMEQGWHVTTARAGSGIFWQPAITAEGEYEARAAFHLMTPAPHPEAFGLFIGGRELEVAGQQYVYFIVRQTGEFMIRQRRGDETEDVVGWTAHDAVPTALEEEPTTYELGVDVGADQVAFTVNGAQVHAMPADQIHTDGVVGLRINHMLELHVESIEVTPR